MFLPEIIDLAPGSCKSILDRDFCMCVSAIIRGGATDHDIFMGRQSQQDVDLKARSVAMVVARTDHRDPAGGNAMIMRFEPLKFTLDTCTNWIRRLASLERHEQRILHLRLLSLAPMS
jgi:hypothetical protein